MSINLEPLEFLERISKFIPCPRKHRRHYHGAFAQPKSQFLNLFVYYKRLLSSVPPILKEAAMKTEKVLLNWAKLIARIYEVNPLICRCGKEIKIVAFVTHSAEIRRILGRIGWTCEKFEFDPLNNIFDCEVCQLIPGTPDGFSIDTVEYEGEGGPDPPFIECCVDPPHREDNRYSPHWNG